MDNPTWDYSTDTERQSKRVRHQSNCGTRAKRVILRRGLTAGRVAKCPWKLAAALFCRCSGRISIDIPAVFRRFKTEPHARDRRTRARYQLPCLLLGAQLGNPI